MEGEERQCLIEREREREKMSRSSFIAFHIRFSSYASIIFINLNRIEFVSDMLK